MNIQISFEKEALLKILFSKKPLNQNFFNSLDYEKFIKISSEYLMLPVTYVKLKNKNYLQFIPKDLNIFLKEIYSINFNKNQVLLKEMQIIDKELKKGKIPRLYIKGCANIKSEIYNDIGERMLGDIDFLISDDKIKQCAKIMTGNLSYKFSKINTKFWKKRHLPRLTSSEKIYAIEIHSKVTNYDYLNSQLKLNIKKYQNDLATMAKIIILNYQLNDYGHFKANYSIRSIYDVVQIMKRQRINVNENKYFRRFFLISNLLGITQIKIDQRFLDKIYIKRFLLKINYKVIFIIDEFFCNKVILIKKRGNQLIEFIFNKNYRSYVFNKSYI